MFFMFISDRKEPTNVGNLLTLGFISISRKDKTVSLQTRGERWFCQKFLKSVRGTYLVFGEHGLRVLVLRSGPPGEVCQSRETHLLQVCWRKRDGL